jgi:hypothetical protein
LRLYTSVDEALSCGVKVKPVLDAALAIATIAGTILSHPAGMMITTCHDMGLNVYYCCGAIKKHDTFEAIKQIAKLTNNTFYLLTMVYASIEIQIASLTIQVVVYSISSIHEFKEGDWIEGTADFLMAAIQTNQLYMQVQIIRLKWKIEEAVKRIFVGELHEKWQFPSDHLPVGVRVEDMEIVSWNVLNTAFMEWVIEKDTQGLNRSLISDMNISIKPDGLTARDQYIIQLIGTNLNGNKGIFALQECGFPFLEHLEKSLPQNWKMVRTTNNAAKDQDVILYNSSLLTYRPDHSETSYNSYPSAPGRSLMNASFERNDQKEKIIRIFNAHIPGDPALPARQEFANYVFKHYSSNETTIALGDNNFEHHEMFDAFRNAGFLEFALHTPWYSNIDPLTKESKGIDHIFVKGASSQDLSPNEVLGTESHLKETLELLKQGITSNQL